MQNDTATQPPRIDGLPDVPHGLRTADGGEPARFEAVDRLAELLGRTAGHRVLELGTGAGRVGPRLAGRGFEVVNVVDSADLVAALGARRRHRPVQVWPAGLAEVGAPGPFDLALAVDAALCTLVTQDDQVSCVRNVAARLAPAGLFVVETPLPSARELAAQDPVGQVVTENHLAFSPAGIRPYSVVHRHVWPAELDLMARLAGLTLRLRWGGWSFESVTPRSESVVSVYGR